MSKGVGKNRSRLLSRREFVAMTASMCAAGVLPAQAAARPFLERHAIPLGLQLYMLSAQLKDNLAGTLAAVANMGYVTVELAGLLGKTPGEWQQALASSGLKCPAAHFSPRPLRPGPSLQDPPDAIADLARSIGFEKVVASLFYIPERFELAPQPGEDLAKMLARISAAMTLEDWQHTAEFLNVTAAALHRVGLSFAYHNHNNEFAPVGGTTGMAVLMQRTDPKLVSFEMDAGWVAAAGVDPLMLLSKYPGRFSGMHVKDIKASTKSNYAFQLDPAEVGEGTLSWARILSRAYAANVRQFYVEQEAPFAKPPLEEAAAGAAFLKRLV